MASHYPRALTSGARPRWCWIPSGGGARTIAARPADRHRGGYGISRHTAAGARLASPRAGRRRVPVHDRAGGRHARHQRRLRHVLGSSPRGRHVVRASGPAGRTRVDLPRRWSDRAICRPPAGGRRAGGPRRRRPRAPRRRPAYGAHGGRHPPRRHGGCLAVLVGRLRCRLAVGGRARPLDRHRSVGRRVGRARRPDRVPARPRASGDPGRGRCLPGGDPAPLGSLVGPGAPAVVRGRPGRGAVGRRSPSYAVGPPGIEPVRGARRGRAADRRHRRDGARRGLLPRLRRAARPGTGGGSVRTRSRHGHRLPGGGPPVGRWATPRSRPRLEHPPGVDREHAAPPRRSPGDARRR